MLTGNLPKVRLKLKVPEEGRYTPDGVVAEDDMYLHTSKHGEFLCDASGILELPPSPEQRLTQIQINICICIRILASLQKNEYICICFICSISVFALSVICFI